LKQFLKIFLPPFIGFSLYFLGVRYSPEYFNLTIGEIGAGTLAGFMAYYKFTLPVLFVIAILTQGLIIIPIWNSVIKKRTAAKLATFIILGLVCILFAGSISYLIWDQTTGIHFFIRTFLFMTAVQLVYWTINIGMLIIIE
jgi:hypothetical protein